MRADPLTQRVARRVLTLRKERGMSGAALSKRVHDLGVTAWNDSTVSKLETGRRESVSATELFALAVALDVPVPLLLADPRDADPVPIVEGVSVPGWEALLWLIGSGTVAETDGAYERSAWLIHSGWTTAETLGELKRHDHTRDATDARHRNALRRLAVALVRIEASGAPVPELSGWVYARAQELGVVLPGAPVDDEVTA